MDYVKEATRSCEVTARGTVCGEPATVVFRIGPRLTIHRCASHAADFRRTLTIMLKNESWTEQRVLLG